MKNPPLNNTQQITSSSRKPRRKKKMTFTLEKWGVSFGKKSPHNPERSFGIYNPAIVTISNHHNFIIIIMIFFEKSKLKHAVFIFLFWRTSRPSAREHLKCTKNVFLDPGDNFCSTKLLKIDFHEVDSFSKNSNKEKWFFFFQLLFSKT